MDFGHFWWSLLKGCRHRPLLENFATVSSHYMGPWLQAVKNLLLEIIASESALLIRFIPLSSLSAQLKCGMQSGV